MINILKYFCKKCNRFHYHGKIYKNHLIYKTFGEKKQKNSKIKGLKSKRNDKILNKNIINFNYDELRPIAKRQINRLYDKMNASRNNELYIFQINKLIKYEQNRLKKG